MYLELLCIRFQKNVENIVRKGRKHCEKGEIACYKQFLLSHNVFHRYIYSAPKKSVHFLMLNISKISRSFFCKFGMVSPKYTIHRSNIKPIPCWAEMFA